MVDASKKAKEPRTQEAIGHYDPPMENTVLSALSSTREPEKDKKDPPFEKAWGILKEGDASMFVDDVRHLVEDGMEVMPAVREVSRSVGVKGRDLMRAYVEAYR